ncbi:hypothetical protein AB0I53_19215 [Saccharopolyspora sp. NPDC050389]|uniref:hypothetical protein n=1 Tax=Saccharopolyspora sp. NPDC050389 TaxID=3155516 RepID=UPI003408D556
MTAHTRLSYRRKQHGTPWTEDEFRALADEIYAQRRRRAELWAPEDAGPLRTAEP